MKHFLNLLVLLLSTSALAQTTGSVLITDRTFLNDGNGNLGLSLSFHNGTEKTVKYIRITIWPMDTREQNACDDNGVYSLSIKLNGPLAPGKSATIKDSSLIRDCHEQICCLKVMGMKVMFKDNTYIDVFGKGLSEYFHPSLGPDCPANGDVSQTSLH